MYYAVVLHTVMAEIAINVQGNQLQLDKTNKVKAFSSRNVISVLED